MRAEVYGSDGLIEWFGVDGSEWVHVRNGVEVERRPATPSELAPEPPPPLPDIVALANELAAQRARLEATEDALFVLITDSLGVI